MSLGKVESVLKGCPVVANVCVYGDPSKSYVVAVVCPVADKLREIAAKFGKAELEVAELCGDKDVTGAVLREVVNHAKASNLEKFEIPGALTLTEVRNKYKFSAEGGKGTHLDEVFTGLEHDIE